MTVLQHGTLDLVLDEQDSISLHVTGSEVPLVDDSNNLCCMAQEKPYCFWAVENRMFVYSLDHIEEPSRPTFLRTLYCGDRILPGYEPSANASNITHIVVGNSGGEELLICLDTIGRIFVFRTRNLDLRPDVLVLPSRVRSISLCTEHNLFAVVTADARVFIVINTPHGSITHFAPVESPLPLTAACFNYDGDQLTIIDKFGFVQHYANIPNTLEYLPQIHPKYIIPYGEPLHNELFDLHPSYFYEVSVETFEKYNKGPPLNEHDFIPSLCSKITMISRLKMCSLYAEGILQCEIPVFDQIRPLSRNNQIRVIPRLRLFLYFNDFGSAKIFHLLRVKRIDGYCYRIMDADLDFAIGQPLPGEDLLYTHGMDVVCLGPGTMAKLYTIMNDQNLESWFLWRSPTAQPEKASRDLIEALSSPNLALKTTNTPCVSPLLQTRVQEEDGESREEVNTNEDTTNEEIEIE